ncbi:MAG TPA: gamma-glutamyl-gamma-aminobutyrate hydrolase family protein, partial [Verrucomicrobiae bacterium]|nr:gamma-glutamyl-gamma-aminobutyrate hydrolase family protein [Verrucomicrobiae bacterium]
MPKPRRLSPCSAPLILISPETELKGDEFGDTSISLSESYQKAVIAAGGLPLALPCVADRATLAESLRRADGILLTGGNDINPHLYSSRVSQELMKTVGTSTRERDLRELILVDEIFRQRKPVFGICRGHQILNVALGGTLFVDIARQVPGAIDHKRFDQKGEVVHRARLTAGSMLAKIARKQRLGVNSTHHQAVARVASALYVTAASDDGIVEALELKR